MYRSFNYHKIFEAEQTGTPVTQDGNNASKKAKELAINVTDESVAQLESAIESNGIFEVPIYKVTYADKTTENTGVAYFMFVEPGGQLSPENMTKASQLIAVPQNYVFLVEKTENHKLSAVLELAGSTVGEMATNFFTRYNTSAQIGVTFVKSDGSTGTTETPAEEAPVEAPSDETAASTPDEEMIATAMTTGEMIGANPSESATRSVMSFDAFVSEAKGEDKWIAGVMKDIKKGGLRKEMGKKKGEKITPAEIKKSEAALKKKDKDKKKPGLQLNKKDAKTHKRNVLAKNLMKASGAMNESRQAKIKGAKDQLVKIHEVIEKMIKQTSKKSTK